MKDNLKRKHPLLLHECIGSVNNELIKLLTAKRYEPFGWNDTSYLSENEAGGGGAAIGPLQATASGVSPSVTLVMPKNTQINKAQWSSPIFSCFSCSFPATTQPEPGKLIMGLLFLFYFMFLTTAVILRTFYLPQEYGGVLVCSSSSQWTCSKTVNYSAHQAPMSLLWMVLLFVYRSFSPSAEYEAVRDNKIRTIIWAPLAVPSI